MEAKYLSTKEVAQRLGVTIMSVNRWVHAGRLRAFKFSENAMRIREDDLEKFIQNSVVVPKKGQSQEIVGDKKEDFSTARSLRKFVGTWAGNDSEEVLKRIIETRSDAEF